MAAAKKDKARKPQRLKIRAHLEGDGNQDIHYYAYAFDRAGNYLDSAEITKNTATLNRGAESADAIKLFLGPPLPDENAEQTPKLEMMERMRAYQPVWKYEAENAIQELLPVPEIHWDYWIWCSCRIRGQVVRPVTRGDEEQDMPVCHARVHICEVDPLYFIIRKLPERVIYRLRDELIKLIEIPPYEIPYPQPDPPPFEYDTRVADPSPLAISKMVRSHLLQKDSTMLGPQPEPPDLQVLGGKFSRPTGINWINPQPEPPGISMLDINKIRPQPEPPPLPGLSTKTRIDRDIASINPQPEPPGISQLVEKLDVSVRAKLASTSLTTVRQALLDNIALIQPYLCFWPWFWPFYRCDEIAVLETDRQGRFDSSIFYLCAGDQPDLYFWVEYYLEGAWTTVYKPPLPCNIHWNYTCADEITLRVRDPRVLWCDETTTLAGKQVAVMTIGHSVSIQEAQGVLTGNQEGLTKDGRPFGGSLEPHVWFGEDLITAGITHYRWSYRRLTEGDGVTVVSDNWHIMDRTVVRHYAVVDTTSPEHPLTFKPFLLGPDPDAPVANLFKIQPKDPPEANSSWAPMIDARENTASAFFLSHLLQGGDALAAAGKYEIKLELFNTAGNLVNLDDEGVLLKIPAAGENAPFGPTQVDTMLAPDYYRIVTAVVGATEAFRMVLHIDNNPCEAEIYAVQGAALSVNENCGFVHYDAVGNDVNVAFKARHENGFANFNFRIHRGTGTNIPQAHASGKVDETLINGYARDSNSIFSKALSVNTLLTSKTPVGVDPCDRAAFAETLHVDALATDGWRILQYLDDDATPVAFALAPDE